MLYGALVSFIERWIISLKRKYVLIIFLLFIIFYLLTTYSLRNCQPANGNIQQNNTVVTNTQKPEATDKLNEIYEAFLQNRISSEDKEDKESYYLRDYWNGAVLEDSRIRYALFDMTGDEIPELHILTNISYSIHTIENNHLVKWFGGDRYCRPLNNRAIIQKIDNGTGYIVLNDKGEEVLCVSFSKSGNDYRFSTGGGDIKLSKKKWEKLTKPFLAIDSDKIIWEDVNLNFLK